MNINKQTSDLFAQAWRTCRRPTWPRHNPCNKRWFIELQARHHRDTQMEDLRQQAASSFLNNYQHAALRQLARLSADDEIDELCMPEWAAQAFRWPWKESSCPG